MVQWIDYHNTLKSKASSILLAPSQIICLEKILEYSEFANRINLFGVSGVGKTFIAWVLHKEHGLLYLSNADEKYINTNVMLIDEAPHDRDECRNIYDTALEYSNSVILITRQPIEDHITHIKLELTNKDLYVINKTMYRECNIVTPLIGPGSGMLWNYLIQKVGE